MKMFLLGFSVCYIITSLFYFLDDEVGTDLMAVFVAPWNVVWLIASFIPRVIWRFVWFYFKPVRSDAMEILKDAYVKRLFGNIYFCYDKKAKNWMNKIFLFRYKSSN